MGSEAGGQRAAAIYSLVVTAKLNVLDPQDDSVRKAAELVANRRKTITEPQRPAEVAA